MTASEAGLDLKVANVSKRLRVSSAKLLDTATSGSELEGPSTNVPLKSENTKKVVLWLRFFSAPTFLFDSTDYGFIFRLEFTKLFEKQSSISSTGVAGLFIVFGVIKYA